MPAPRVSVDMLELGRVDHGAVDAHAQIAAPRVGTTQP